MPILHEIVLNQILHTAQADGFATGERFAVGDADGFSPIGGFVAQAIQKSRRLLRASGNELALITGDSRHFLFPIGADV